MKKLRMIVSSVIVLAIVGSAFAFSAKKVAVFCVDTSPFSGTGACDGTIDFRYITTQNGTEFKYFTNWNGLASTCTPTSGNTNCTTDVRLAID